jgi:hypothetical protein
VDFPAARMIAMQEADVFGLGSDNFARFMMKDDSPGFVISAVHFEIWIVHGMER